MANSIPMQKKNGHYLWFALLGLGFQPVNIKHLNLGPNMFNKPNKEAFYLVTRFLLEKLNPVRFHESYRHCWPVVNHKADTEFRKVTCTWLREIMDEMANAGSKVVMSLFLSPGGPKFVSLMLYLATHVMQQDMKTFVTDKSWAPEAAAMPASTPHIAVERLNLVRSRFLKAAVDQDRFLHDYQRRAQAVVKSMRDLKVDGSKYDQLLKHHVSEAPWDADSFSEKIKKVRSLWSAIEGMLSAIKEQQTAVESVLKGDVDQYVLDGTNRVLKLPRCLLDRIERLPHQLISGSVYEAGQLNLLCVMELLNHALQLLKEERSRVSPAAEPPPAARRLQEHFHQMSRVLQDLHLIRQKLSKEEIPEVRSAIAELQAEWDQRWMETLKEKPLVSFLNEDPALCFLSPTAPLSFEPAPEASYSHCVFYQFPAKFLEDKPAEIDSTEDVKTRLDIRSPTVSGSSEHPVIPQVSRANASLDWLFDTPASPPQKPSAVPPPANICKTTHQKVAPLKTKTEILDLEHENLADQFADAVTTTSPPEAGLRGLEGLLGNFQRDPFTARTQLPRTPESLIMDVKSSWRRAVEEDEAKKAYWSAELQDSITDRLSPVGRLQDAIPDASAQTLADQSSSSFCKQLVFPKSPPLWDTLNTEAHDSPSGTGSSAVQFSLDYETLPEMPSCDSLDLEDEAVALTSEEDEEVLVPTLKMTLKQTLLTSPDYKTSRVEDSWLAEPAASEGKRNKVFSLDSPDSPPTKQEYSLPTLITFSPIDDMKC
ncbi:HAUS augmin-like complex subunit 6 [Xiphophorus couchianus]|uniref:HAUS augmin-like complex subunit 6 n=1 Tax=Xiphophorus couchianus TaxID=32473 RepID=UPI00101711B4|nr:HAUS augmin-like complex subunit 6 [Xiphophorus couchianus]XP_027895144.1 HAUS augmin-like complex subunit 6 [Xiphophorus couchianus]XP_027895145.1 HAUS augmin-like complex subunit 6 [Xiphophorus couchianus]